MKKIITTIVSTALMFSGFIGTVHADTPVCGLNTTAETPTASSTTFTQVCGNGNPMMVNNAWGLTGYQTPIVPGGATVTDKYGYSETCSKMIFGITGCFDLTGTVWYDTYMNTMVRQAMANGTIGQFPHLQARAASLQ